MIRITEHTAERTAGVHCGTAAFSVDMAASGEYFRIDPPVAKLAGSDLDVVIEAIPAEEMAEMRTELRDLRALAAKGTGRH